MTDTPPTAPTRDLTALAVTDALTARHAASRLAHRATAVKGAAPHLADALKCANGNGWRVNGRSPHEYVTLTVQSAREALTASLTAWGIGEDAMIAQSAGEHALAVTLAEDTAQHAEAAQRHAQLALDTFQLLAAAVMDLTRSNDEPMAGVSG